MATGLGTPNIGTLAPLIAKLPPWLFQRLVEQRQCLPERTVARIEQQILVAGVRNGLLDRAPQLPLRVPVVRNPVIEEILGPRSRRH
jgi:hypothetical protein